MISNALHRLAHWLDPSPCTCMVGEYMRGWKRARDMELRSLFTPSSPAALDAELRRKIADSERPAA